MYLGKEHVTQATLQQIRAQLTTEDFEMIIKHIEHMPAWLANIFYHFQKGEPSD